MEERVCVICGKPFIPKNKTQMCCSSVCAKKKSETAQRRTMICKHCGVQFWRRCSHPVKFCSDECRRQDYIDKHPKKEKPEKKLYVNKCEWCGKEYETSYPHQKYCSPACGYEGNKRLQREKWKQAFIPKKLICKECGLEFETECGTPRSAFCCQTCASRNEAKKEKGKPYKKEEQKRYRDRREKLKRLLFVEDVSFDDVFQRDNGICQICGLPVDTNKDMNSSWDGTIDHIIPLSQGGPHRLSNCQLSHRICNSLKGTDGSSFRIDWNEKSKENNYWKRKLDDYLSHTTP